MMQSVLRYSVLALVTLAWAVPSIANDERTKQKDDESPTQARLGIAVTSLPEMLASHLPDVFEKGRGVLVSEVIPGSAADKAGIQRYDVLVRYDDQDLYSPEQLVKRIRNDQPGATIGLEYVRAGKLQAAKVTLDEEPEQERVYAENWPGLISRFNVPLSPLRPEFLTEAQDALGEGTEWTEFVSLSMTKQDDGTYVVRIVYNDREGTSIRRDFTGTRQEIRDAINDDNDLPESRKEQLLRTLDDRGRVSASEFDFQMPKWDSWRRELFDWPNIDF